MNIESTNNHINVRNVKDEVQKNYNAVKNNRYATNPDEIQ